MFDYLRYGLAAGGVAGVAYGLFMATIATPMTEALHHAGHHGHHAAKSAVVADSTTTTLVSIGGGLLWAILLGGGFGLAMFVFEPALPGLAAVRSAVLAACGFLTVSAVPWLVVPPATPLSEHAYGIDTRLAIYGGLVGVGAAVAAVAVAGYRRIAPRHRALGVAVGVAPIVGTAVVLPAITPTVVTHPGLPTDLVAAYEAMVAVGQAGIWLVIAATFGWLQDRAGPSSLAGSTKPTPTEST